MTTTTIDLQATERAVNSILDDLAKHISEQTDVTEGVPLKPDEPICVHIRNAYRTADALLAALQLATRAPVP